MKNGRHILLLVCGLSLTLLIGVFIGRNSISRYAPLGGTSGTESVATASVDMDYRMDINTATKIQLMELPGIGETIADRILDYRDQNGMFSATDELLNVDGIGEKKLLQIEPYIRIGG